MFWLGGQETYGSENDTNEKRQEYAMKSREDVMKSEKYQQIFAPYAAAIGIDTDQNLPEW